MGESRYRLAWVVCLLLLLGVLSSSISSYYVSRRNVRQTITESSLPLTSDNIYSVIQRDLLQPIFISSMMANDAFLRDWAMGGERDVEQIKRYLDEIRREYNTVTTFFISEETRNYYYWGGILKQVSEREPRDDWYFRVRQMDKPFEINVDPDMANRDTMTIFVNYRVFDYSKRYIGAAGTGLTVTRVNALIEEYEERFDREIFFVGEEGRIVLAPSDSGLAAFESIQNIPGLAASAQMLLDAELEQRVEYERDGQTYFLNSRYIPELNWFLMVEQSEDQLLKPLRKILLGNIALALLITALVAALTVTAIRRNQKRLEQRNAELSQKNAEIRRQKEELEHGARELEGAYAKLSLMSKEKDDFLSLVAHDLRSPLSAAIGVCDMLEDELPAGENPQREYVGYIRRCGFQMIELIGDILDVSAIEAFHGPVDLEPVDWNALIRSCGERFVKQAGVKGIRLDFQLAAEAGQSVLTREKWLSICVNNVLSNAVKYTPPGTTVTVQTARLEGGAFEVRIVDEGPGIRQEEMDKVFHRFKTLSARPTGGETSTGLGLYIVQKMCQRLGATVSIDPACKKGSCFIIRHPDYRELQI